MGTFLVLGCDGESRQRRNRLGRHAWRPAEPEPTMRFGVVWDGLVVDSGKVKSGQSLSHLLDPAGIGPGQIATGRQQPQDMGRAVHESRTPLVARL